MKTRKQSTATETYVDEQLDDEQLDDDQAVETTAIEQLRDELRIEIKPHKPDAAELLMRAAGWFCGAAFVCIGLVYMIKSGLSRKDAGRAFDYARELQLDGVGDLRRDSRDTEAIAGSGHDARSAEVPPHHE